ncbi:hypothetical protein D5086_012576 [Populus alba]|uniref:Uncharacterized protein n=1 Tax=Populus alba TaxID=43335 RepID=A0ACC4C2I4_POPAL
MAGCFQTSEWCVDGQPARYLAGKGGGFVVLPGRGHVAGHALWINVAPLPPAPPLHSFLPESFRFSSFQDSRGSSLT